MLRSSRKIDCLISTMNPLASRVFSALTIAGVLITLLRYGSLFWQCFFLWIVFGCTLGEWIYACFFHPEKKSKTSILFYATGVFYLLYAFFSLHTLLIKPQGSVWIFVTACIVAFSDMGAFFGGKYFGGPKLFPSISPNKTWSGFFSGTLLACLTGSFLFSAFMIHPLSWPLSLLYSLVIALLAPIGDALESKVKRYLGIKDMSRMIPGHGGLLDRLDSHLIVFIFVDLLCFFSPFWDKIIGY